MDSESVFRSRKGGKVIEKLRACNIELKNKVDDLPKCEYFDCTGKLQAIEIICIS